MLETTLEKISRKSGRKPNECKCQTCQGMCRRQVCIGTPEDIMKLINAGHIDKLAFTQWAVGVGIGVTRHIIPMVQINYDRELQACPFFDKGLCGLHHNFLKPTEGKLTNHNEGRDPEKSVVWMVAQEWINPANYLIISAIIEKMALAEK